jgi:hypothetical protein
MRSGASELAATSSARLREFASSPYRSQIPVISGLVLCLLAWAWTQSTIDLEISFLILFLVTVGWEFIVLLEQNRAESRPSPEKIEAHNWLRARTIAWSIVAIAFAGLVLTGARLNTGLSSTLIPGNVFPLTEIVVLALTIAVLAVLTRYSAIASYVESTRTSAELGRVMGEVRDSLRELKSSIEGLTHEVSHLGAQTARPALQGSVFHLSPNKKTHSIAWRLSAVESAVRNVSLTITVDGIRRATETIGDIAAGAHREGRAGNVPARPQTGEISLEVSYLDADNRSRTDSFDFAYTVETGIWGGIKSVNVYRI